MARISKKVVVRVWQLLWLRSLRVTRVSSPDSLVSTTFKVRLERTLVAAREVASVIDWRAFFSASFKPVFAFVPPPKSAFTTSTLKPTFALVVNSKPACLEISRLTSVVSRRVPDDSPVCSNSKLVVESSVRVKRSHLKISIVCSSCGPRVREFTIRPRL